MDKINKVVLAYSGGLDTSVILRWLKETYQCEVATFTANLGQDEDYDLVKAKAEKQGTKESPTRPGVRVNNCVKK